MKTTPFVLRKKETASILKILVACDINNIIIVVFNIIKHKLKSYTFQKYTKECQN